MKRDENKRVLLAIRILGRYLILLQLSVASVFKQLEGFSHLGTCLAQSLENKMGYLDEMKFH